MGLVYGRRIGSRRTPSHPVLEPLGRRLRLPLDQPLSVVNGSSHASSVIGCHVLDWTRCGRRRVIIWTQRQVRGGSRCAEVVRLLDVTTEMSTNIGISSKVQRA